MQCQMHEKNLRTFASAIQCLAKVGKELILSCTRSDHLNSLILSTVNDATTAFCVFRFNQNFFESFSLDGTMAAKKMAIKISMKAWISALKSHRTTEKLTIKLTDQETGHFLSLISHCKQGLVKTNILSYEDTNFLSAVVDRTNSRNRITARTILLQNAIRNVYGSEELCLAVDHNHCIHIKSHFQHANAQSEVETLKTNIMVKFDELEKYKVADCDDEVAFSMKEIKALLQFCENHDFPVVSLFFSAPGDSLSIASDSYSRSELRGDAGQNSDNKTYSFELVMATLEAEEIDRMDEGDDGDPELTTDLSQDQGRKPAKSISEKESVIQENLVST